MTPTVKFGVKTLKRESLIVMQDNSGAWITMRRPKWRLIRRHPWLALSILPQLACTGIVALSVVGMEGSIARWMFEHTIIVALMAAASTALTLIPWLCVAEAESANDVMRVRMIMHGLSVPEDDGL